MSGTFNRYITEHSKTKARLQGFEDRIIGLTGITIFQPYLIIKLDGVYNDIKHYYYDGIRHLYIQSVFSLQSIHGCVLYSYGKNQPKIQLIKN